MLQKPLGSGHRKKSSQGPNGRRQCNSSQDKDSGVRCLLIEVPHLVLYCTSSKRIEDISCWSMLFCLLSMDSVLFLLGTYCFLSSRIVSTSWILRGRHASPSAAMGSPGDYSAGIMIRGATSRHSSYGSRGASHRSYPASLIIYDVWPIYADKNLGTYRELKLVKV